MARAFAQEFAKELKQPVVVENKPGAGNAIAGLAVKAAPANGYTLLFIVDELLSSKISNPELEYEISDFEIIAPVSRTPYTLLTPTDLHINSLDDLKALAAKKNGEVNFGTLGLGASLYPMLSRTLSAHLGIKEVMVPYKSGVEGIAALMSGQIDGFLSTAGLAYAQKNNPKLHPFGFTTDGPRSPFLPEVKSFKELGIDGMTWYTLYGVALRADTPEPVKAYLRDAAARVGASAELKKIRAQIALEDPGTLDQFKAEMQRNSELIRAAYLQSKKQ
jgi:tripartite-type tricarboxylate transporter receptor subunit TctC